MSSPTSRVDALIEKLSEIHPKGFDLSLGRITALLEKLGSPHLRIPPAIHVAGTNGKGSTLAFVRAILEAGGYSVHVHTSPHLVNWNERYRLAGKLVDDDVLADAIERVTEANGGKAITIFEIMSAVMFVLFSEHRADFSLVEVGLGGRFDATNVLQNPQVCAITPISMDHQSYLGDTLGKIAFEKAGIIKARCPVVIGVQTDEVRDILEDIAAERSAPAQIAGQDFDFYRDATGFVFQDEQGLLDLHLPKLNGAHQLANAAVAIAAIRAGGIEIADTAIATGLQKVRWPGRLEKLPEGIITRAFSPGSNIWIDGGHNPAAGEAISAELIAQNRTSSRKVLLVCGMINTKEPEGYFKPFKALDAEVIAVPVAMSDAGIAPHDLARSAQSAGLAATSAESLQDGITEAAQIAANQPDAQIIFCGSLYMVGEVLDRNGTPPK